MAQRFKAGDRVTIARGSSRYNATILEVRPQNKKFPYLIVADGSSPQLIAAKWLKPIEYTRYTPEQEKRIAQQAMKQWREEEALAKKHLGPWKSEVPRG